MRISAALLPWNRKLAQTGARRLRVPPAAALGRRLRLFALGADQNERQLRHLHTDLCLLTRTSPRAMRGGPEASLTKGGIGGTKSTLGTNHLRNCVGSAAAGRTEPLKLSPQIVVVA